MKKLLKKTLLGSVSLLAISCFFWILLILNPKYSYAKATDYDFVTVYHNQALDKNTEAVLNEAIDILKQSPLFHEGISLQLCMNDDEYYPHLNPLVGQPYAYAFLNKTVLMNCAVNFDENVAVTEWAVNDNEVRRFDLAYVLAHEFAHNLQFDARLGYVVKSTLGKRNWKLEGHADYIARRYKNDGDLKARIAKLVLEQQQDHLGLPVFDLPDGTKQIVSYYKYSLVVQYLMEEKGLTFDKLCDLKTGVDGAYAEMIEWSVQ
ncbi:MAG: hypothetical protein AB8F78_07435 [Saprospiraceae bacterium]